MKRSSCWTGLIVALVLAAPVVAQDAPPEQRQRRVPGATAPLPPVGLTRDATLLLEHMARRYAEAPALRDAVVIEAGGQVVRMDVAFDGDRAVLFKVPGLTVTALDGSLMVERDDVDDKYLHTPYREGFTASMASLFGPNMNLPVHFLMREQADHSGAVDAYVHRMSLGMFRGPILETAETVQVDGVKRHVLRFTGTIGRMEVAIDAATLLMHSVTVLMPSPAGEAGEPIRATIRFSPTITDTLEPPIQFNPAGRKAVSSVAELVPKQIEPVAAGDMAPAFTLATLQGERVSLEKLKGSVVVLDFWATWCGPCRASLPMLEEFAIWAKDSGHPIKVYAVNVWERVAGKQRLDAVADYWRGAGYTVPVLLDEHGMVIKSYGFTSIPSLVVIDTDGRVVRAHRGMARNMGDLLKSDVKRVFEKP